MRTYSWVGYMDFQESDPHIFCGRIEIFDDNGGWAIAEHTVRYKQVFPNEMDFRDWVDDLESEEVLKIDEIFMLFLEHFPQMEIHRLEL